MRARDLGIEVDRGRPGRRTRSRGSEIGALGYVAKPSNISDLLDAVERLRSPAA